MQIRCASRLAGSVGFVAALLVALPTAVQATLPGRNGDLAFSLLGEGESDEIGYFTTNGDIALMSPAGKRRRLIASGYSAAFSPTGRLLAVSQYPSGELVLRRTDGGKVRRLTRGSDLQPSWSPSGRRLAFSRQRCEGDAEEDTLTCAGRLFTIRVDGRDRQIIAEDAFDPSWSARGKLVYEAASARNTAYPGGEGGDIMVIDPRRGGPRTVAVDAVDPDWSPTGAELAFVRSRGRHSAVFVARADGSQPRRIYVTRGMSATHEPVWSPDGHWIAFIRNGAVYRIDPDGQGHLRRLVSSGWSPPWHILDSEPTITGLAWQPLRPTGLW